VPDPAEVQGNDEGKRRAFFRAYSELSRRIDLFTALPVSKLDRLALKLRLEEIGKIED
jgi:arsenate reductase